MDFKPVINRYSNVYDDVVHITIRDLDTLAEQTILSNRIHAFFVAGRQPSWRLASGTPDRRVEEDSGGRWVQAQKLHSGQRLLNSDETWSEVVDVKIESRALLAYNLNVAEFHTYFVKHSSDWNADAVWVDNCPPDIWQTIAADVAKLRGRHGSIVPKLLKADVRSVIDQILGANPIPRTTQDLTNLFPNQRVHDLTGNFRGWTSIDPVPDNAHAHAGVRILAKQQGDSWLFRVADTH
jgi:hypothetical protein